jgi:hypothetical protein
VEQITHRLTIKIEEMSRQDFWDGLSIGTEQIGMEGILQIRGRFCQIESARAQNKPCYNRARLDTLPSSVKRKSFSRSATNTTLGNRFGYMSDTCRTTRKFI